MSIVRLLISTGAWSGRRGKGDKSHKAAYVSASLVMSGSWSLWVSRVMTFVATIGLGRSGKESDCCCWSWVDDL